MSGFVLIHRDLFGNPQFRGKDDEYAALWLVVHAAWESCTVRTQHGPITLERGQCAYAMSYLAKAWQCSKDAAHRRLLYLDQCGFIKTQPGRTSTIITICNYNKYQANQDAARTPDKTQPGRSPDEARTNNKEDKEDKEGYKDSRPSIFSNEQSAFDAYNALAARIDLPKAQVFTDARKSRIRQRLHECGGLSGWVDVLDRLEASSFLRGGSANGWKADLDFLLQAKSFTKLMEGSYDDQKPTQNPTGSSRIASDDERRRRLAAAAGADVDYGG